MTDGVTLRPLQRKDAESMLEWLHNEDITRYLQLKGNETTIDDCRDFIDMSQDESVNLHRAIVNADDDYLGTVSLKSIDSERSQAEYAISMHQRAIGTGAAKTGSLLIIQLAYSQLGIKRVYLNVLKANQRAVRFYNKLGFTYTHSSNTVVNGEEQELLWYESVRGVTKLC